MTTTRTAEKKKRDNYSYPTSSRRRPTPSEPPRYGIPPPSPRPSASPCGIPTSRPRPIRWRVPAFDPDPPARASIACVSAHRKRGAGARPIGPCPRVRTTERRADDDARATMTKTSSTRGRPPPTECRVLPRRPPAPRRRAWSTTARRRRTSIYHRDRRRSPPQSRRRRTTTMTMIAPTAVRMASSPASVRRRCCSMRGGTSVPRGPPRVMPVRRRAVFARS